MATVDELCQSDSYKQLVEAVARGAIAFVGAGTSIPLGYPPWGRLLDVIGEEAERFSPGHPELVGAKTNEDVLVRAGIYCGILGDDRLGRLVAGIYGPKPVQFTRASSQPDRDTVPAFFDHKLRGFPRSCTSRISGGKIPPPGFRRSIKTFYIS